MNIVHGVLNTVIKAQVSKCSNLNMIEIQKLMREINLMTNSWTTYYTKLKHDNLSDFDDSRNSNLFCLINLQFKKCKKYFYSPQITQKRTLWFDRNATFIFLLQIFWTKNVWFLSNHIVIFWVNWRKNEWFWKRTTCT